MASETAVEYSSNSRASNVNIVHPSTSGTPETPNPCLNKGVLPVRFERASTKWWDYRLDSRVLEDQYKISSLPQYRSLFRHSLVYTFAASVVWAVYYAASNATDISWVAGTVWSLILAIISLVLLIVSNRDKLYHRYFLYLNAAFLFSIAVTALVSAYYIFNLVTVVGSFFLISVVILLIYLILPLPVPILCVVAVIASILYEVLLQVGSTSSVDIGSQILLLICVNVFGCQMVIDLQIIRHSTFLKICRCIQAAQEKRNEEVFIDFMVKSVMPPTIAKQLLIRNSDQDEKKPNGLDNKNKSNFQDNKSKTKLIFRPFTMERMDNVSILYADIVGFTQMSSKKSAAELVRLLNDLFGRFDNLCIETNCEKISTLGDCYYCVAGCPIPRDDHARCCVEMGLGMVSVIKEFCEQQKINVNMRVGIHTGYVLCGVVGTRRFKFDVWSNDVTLANGMEQHGIPGRVHISKTTLENLKGEYEVEDSGLEMRLDGKNPEFLQKTGNTYLVVEPKKKKDECTNNVKSNGSEIQTTNNRLPPSGGENEENEVGSNNSSSNLLRTDQLSRMLEQHFNPVFLSGNALVKLRKKETDMKLLQSISNDLKTTDVYDVKEANAVTLRFRSPDQEGMYRSQFEQELEKDNPVEYCTTPRYRFFKDIIFSALLTLLLSVSSILLFGSDASNPIWIVVFVILFLILVASAVAGGLYLFHKRDLQNTRLLSCLTFCSTWTLRHVIGAIFLLIPAAVVLSYAQLSSTPPACSSYLLLFILVLIHFINYNQLSTWGRALLSALVVAGSLLLAYVNPCQEPASTCVCRDNTLKYEYIHDFLLLFIFVFVINRHFELAYRLDFFCENTIKIDTKEIQKQKDKVNQLVKNFIPNHVREAMAKNKDQLYSKTHEKVGVIFGTIVNFNELYEESYEGGKEFLRFLSELISDVDDLLDKPKYKDIEKIKTIGTTFMLASGLNPDVDQEYNGIDSHLHRLMDFCIDMQNVVDNFNKDMLNFHLVLRIGFNNGEVTAGVIGSTKKLYDIWGDTVNIASRMDSTGVPGRVQVSEESMKVLENHFNFVYQGEKFVKGKGQMKTYLLVRDDEETRKIIPNPVFNYHPF